MQARRACVPSFEVAPSDDAVVVYELAFVLGTVVGDGDEELEANINELHCAKKRRGEWGGQRRYGDRRSAKVAQGRSGGSREV